MGLVDFRKKVIWLTRIEVLSQEKAIKEAEAHIERAHAELEKLTEKQLTELRKKVSSFERAALEDAERDAHEKADQLDYLLREAYLLSARQAPDAPSSYLVDLLVPPDEAEHRTLALQTAYDEHWIAKYGERRARRIFNLQMMGTIVGFWIGWIKDRLDILKAFTPRS